MLRSIAAAAAAAAVLGGCAQETPTKEAFVDHGLAISTNITTDEEREAWKGWYGCAYDRLDDADDVLRDFVDADQIGDLSAESSGKVNEAIGECLAEPGT